MLVQQLAQRLLQLWRLQGLTRVQQQRLVPVVTGNHRLLKKPLLHGRQYHGAAGQTLVKGGLGTQLRHASQAANGLVRKQVTRAEGDPGLTCPADHLNRNDRIATQGKKVVINPDLRHTQHSLPDLRQMLFQCAARRGVALLHR